MKCRMGDIEIMIVDFGIIIKIYSNETTNSVKCMVAFPMDNISFYKWYNTDSDLYGLEIVSTAKSMTIGTENQYSVLIPYYKEFEYLIVNELGFTIGTRQNPKE